ncbi:MAG: hemerythrin domain-containing protein [Deltaproteobacteria bacterium]
MSNGTQLLNDDGSASMATLLMMSHHAFRRDIARFGRALETLSEADAFRLEPLQAEWQSYRDTLHGHHFMEDTRIFPHLKGQQPALAPIIEQLAADHRRIDPLLERGDRAFAGLPETRTPAAVVAELATLLDSRLAAEEASVIPSLRGANEFPPPASDAEAELYAQGFAWSTHGIAPEVLQQVYALLPVSLSSRLPAAIAAFNARCEWVWGSCRARAARTSIPDR